MVGTFLTHQQLRILHTVDSIAAVEAEVLAVTGEVIPGKGQLANGHTGEALMVPKMAMFRVNVLMTKLARPIATVIDDEREIVASLSHAH
jgi:hypothetical protein